MQAPQQQLHPNGPQQPQQQPQQQQQQPHPGMAGAPLPYVLPPNLTRDQVQAMVQVRFPGCCNWVNSDGC
jgi:hypothetical protein